MIWLILGKQNKQTFSLFRELEHTLSILILVFLNFTMNWSVFIKCSQIRELHNIWLGLGIVLIYIHSDSDSAYWFKFLSIPSLYYKFSFNQIFYNLFAKIYICIYVQSFDKK